jgi:hypothetical protein
LYLHCPSVRTWHLRGKIYRLIFGFPNFHTNACIYIYIYIYKAYKKQSHCRPRQALRFPGAWGSQLSRQSAHKGGKVVSLTHRPPLPLGNISGTNFCYRLSQPQGHSAAGRIISMKNSIDTIGNRTRDLPTCSAVPQPTAPPRAPHKAHNNNLNCY